MRILALLLLSTCGFAQTTAVNGWGGSNNYGHSTATAAGGENTVTLGSAPVTNSLLLSVNGVVKPQTSYSMISPTKAKLTSALSAGDVADAGWVTAEAVAGSITLSSVFTQPTLRGTNMVAQSASSLTITFPAGTAAGDLAILFAESGFSISATPTGWTANDTHNGALNISGETFSKVLTSTDITNGSVTVSFGGTFDCSAALAVFSGSTGGIRETDAAQSSTGATSASVTTSADVLSTDYAVYFGSNRGASTNTVNRGIQQQQANDGSAASAVLNTEALTGGGALTATFNYSSAGVGYYQAVVIVKGS